MIAIGIGHDLGLFEVLKDAEQPLSLKDIADKRSLKERYTILSRPCILDKPRIPFLYSKSWFARL